MLKWQWTDKIGVIVKRGFDNQEYHLNIYTCNGFIVILKEWEKDGEQLYTVSDYYLDKKDLKKALGLEKGYTENYWAYDVIGLNLKQCKTTTEILKMVVVAKWEEPLAILIEQ